MYLPLLWYIYLVSYVISHLGLVATSVVSTADIFSVRTTNAWLYDLELSTMMAIIVRITNVIKVASKHSTEFYLHAHVYTIELLFWIAFAPS